MPEFYHCYFYLQIKFTVSKIYSTYCLRYSEKASYQAKRRMLARQVSINKFASYLFVDTQKVHVPETSFQHLKKIASYTDGRWEIEMCDESDCFNDNGWYRAIQIVLHCRRCSLEQGSLSVTCRCCCATYSGRYFTNYHTITSNTACGRRLKPFRNLLLPRNFVRHLTYRMRAIVVPIRPRAWRIAVEGQGIVGFGLWD